MLPGAKKVEAKLDAIEGCNVDNWGMPFQVRKPFTKTYEDVKARCAASFIPKTKASDILPAAMVNHYPSTEAFGHFDGFIMTVSSFANSNY